MREKGERHKIHGRTWVCEVSRNASELCILGAAGQIVARFNWSPTVTFKRQKLAGSPSGCHDGFDQPGLSCKCVKSKTPQRG